MATDTLIRKISDICDLFAKKQIAILVRNAGLGPDVTSSSQIKEMSADRYTAGLSTLEVSVRVLEDLSWDVTFKNDQKLISISTEELLSLDNAGQVSVKNISIEVGRIDPSISISIDSRFSKPASISVRADDSEVRDYIEKVENALDAAVPSWNILRNPWVDWSLFFLGWGIAYSILFDLIDKSISGNIGYTAKVAVFIPLWAAAFFIGKLWAYAFPGVEFVFGGGKERQSSLSGLRKFIIWTIPSSYLALPVLKYVADRIF